MLLSKPRFELHRYGQDKYGLIVKNLRLAKRVNKLAKSYPEGAFQEKDEPLFILNRKTIEVVFSILGVRDRGVLDTQEKE